MPALIQRLRYFFVFCLLTATQAVAQIHGFDEKQIAFGYHYFNVAEYLLEEDDYVVTDAMGPYSIDFKYGISDRVTSSWKLSYRNLKTADETFIDQLDFNKEKLNNFNIDLFTVMVRADINFKSDNYYRFTFYSSIGVGYNFANIHKSSPTAPKLAVELDGIAWQVNPIGFKGLISENFGYFMELGIGHNGFASGGVFFRLWNYKVPKGHF